MTDKETVENKEFLPEIPKDADKFQHLKNNIGCFKDNSDVYVAIKWLIQQVEEKIKVEALAKELDKELNEVLIDERELNGKIGSLMRENQRYKKALEEAYSELQNLYSRNSTFNPVDKEDLFNTLEYVGVGVIKQALKGESE